MKQAYGQPFNPPWRMEEIKKTHLISCLGIQEGNIDESANQTLFFEPKSAPTRWALRLQCTVGAECHLRSASLRFSVWVWVKQELESNAILAETCSPVRTEANDVGKTVWVWNTPSCDRSSEPASQQDPHCRDPPSSLANSFPASPTVGQRTRLPV